MIQHTKDKSSSQASQQALPDHKEIGTLVDLLLDVLLRDEARGVSEGDRKRNAEKLEQLLDQFQQRCTTRETEHQPITKILPDLREKLRLDVLAAYEGDPACDSEIEAALCYPGVHAITVHRIAHELFRRNVPFLPRLLNELVHHRTGIDIHPGARIGASFFIDHGTGVVIGSTTQIGDHCKLYQGVTLGASSVQRRTDQIGIITTKRHPTLEDHVTVYAGATILGGNVIIGAGSVVGGGVFLTESVKPKHIVTYPRPVIKHRPNGNEPPLQFHI